MHTNSNRPSRAINFVDIIDHFLCTSNHFEKPQGFMYLDVNMFSKVVGNH